MMTAAPFWLTAMLRSLRPAFIPFAVVVTLGCSNPRSEPIRAADAPATRPTRDVLAEWHAKADRFNDGSKWGWSQRERVMDEMVATLSPEECRGLIRGFEPNDADPIKGRRLTTGEYVLYCSLAERFAREEASDDLVALLSRRLESWLGTGSIETFLALRRPDGILLLGQVYDRASGEGVRRQVAWAVSRARCDERVRYDAETDSIRWPFTNDASARAYVLEFVEWYRGHSGRVKINMKYREHEMTDLMSDHGPLFVLE